MFHAEPIGMHYNEATLLTNKNVSKGPTTTVRGTVRASASVWILKDKRPY